MRGRWCQQLRHASVSNSKMKRELMKQTWNSFSFSYRFCISSSTYSLSHFDLHWGLYKLQGCLNKIQMFLEPYISWRRKPIITWLKGLDLPLSGVPIWIVIWRPWCAMRAYASFHLGLARDCYQNIWLSIQTKWIGIVLKQSFESSWKNVLWRKRDGENRNALYINSPKVLIDNPGIDAHMKICPKLSFRENICY